MSHPEAVLEQLLALSKGLDEAQQNLNRLRAEFVNMQNNLNLVNLAPTTRKRVSFETALAEVLTGYSDLLQRLSQ